MRFITVNNCNECPLACKVSPARYECNHVDTLGFGILIGIDKTPVGLMKYCPLPVNIPTESISDVLLPIINTILESDNDNAEKAVELMNELKLLFLNRDKE